MGGFTVMDRERPEKGTFSRTSDERGEERFVVPDDSFQFANGVNEETRGFCVLPLCSDVESAGLQLGQLGSERPELRQHACYIGERPARSRNDHVPREAFVILLERNRPVPDGE